MAFVGAAILGNFKLYFLYIYIYIYFFFSYYYFIDQHKDIKLNSLRRKWRFFRLKNHYVNGMRNLYSYWSGVCYNVKEFVPRK